MVALYGLYSFFTIPSAKADGNPLTNLSQYIHLTVQATCLKTPNTEHRTKKQTATCNFPPFLHYKPHHAPLTTHHSSLITHYSLLISPSLRLSLSPSPFRPIALSPLRPLTSHQTTTKTSKTPNTEHRTKTNFQTSKHTTKISPFQTPASKSLLPVVLSSPKLRFYKNNLHHPIIPSFHQSHSISFNLNSIFNQSLINLHQSLTTHHSLLTTHSLSLSVPQSLHLLHPTIQNRYHKQCNQSNQHPTECRNSHRYHYVRTPPFGCKYRQ